jgi:cholesterol transport system auxiliary component
MTASRAWRLAAAAPALAGVVFLGGCVTLFPKAEPSQLYRFEVGAAASATPASGPRLDVQLTGYDFDSAAGGDQLLTTHESSVAFVAGARWEEPASELFHAALTRSLEAGGKLRVVGAGQMKAPLRLRISVTRFEAEYGEGKDAVPTIVVRLHATIERQSDLAVLDERDFEGRTPAEANRVSAMVTAYDVASAKALGDLAGWVADTGAASGATPD